MTATGDRLRRDAQALSREADRLWLAATRNPTRGSAAEQQAALLVDTARRLIADARQLLEQDPTWLS